MKRTNYKGYIIDTDNLGRPYIYNTASPMSEDSDKRYLIAIDYFDTATHDLTELQAAKRLIDQLIDTRVETGRDYRG